LKTGATETLQDPYRWGKRGTAGATIAARLTFDHVSHAYGKVLAIDDVALDVAPGEVICLLGHSGCGKTTLLRIAAGIERQSAGRILVNDKEIAGPAAFLPPERRGIGLMFQDYALFPHLSILENVMFGLNRLSRSEAARGARLALGRVGLEDYAEDFPHVLSGGEQQRVALARAIVPRPSVMLMDEPFSGLDRRLRDSVRDETIAILRETRATAVIVTHDPEEAMRVADRIALMRSGSVTQVGSPRELYEHPADLFVARFFSELNELPGLARHDCVDTPIGPFPAEGFTPGQKLAVCVRPQDVALGPPEEGVPGRVVLNRFLGEVDHVEIVVDALETPLKSRVREVGCYGVGKDVGVRVAPRDVLMFSK
jgi:iron(III) transport system ATP-binding protein